MYITENHVTHEIRVIGLLVVLFFLNHIVLQIGNHGKGYTRNAYEIELSYCKWKCGSRGPKMYK